MSPNLLFLRLPVTFTPIQAQAQAYLFSQPAVVGMCSRPAVTAGPSEETDKHAPSHAGVTPTDISTSQNKAKKKIFEKQINP